MGVGLFVWLSSGNDASPIHQHHLYIYRIRTMRFLSKHVSGWRESRSSGCLGGWAGRSTSFCQGQLRGGFRADEQPIGGATRGGLVSCAAYTVRPSVSDCLLAERSLRKEAGIDVLTLYAQMQGTSTRT
jgi:hypothetical protein